MGVPLRFFLLCYGKDIHPSAPDYIRHPATRAASVLAGLLVQKKECIVLYWSQNVSLAGKS